MIMAETPVPPAEEPARQGGADICVILNAASGGRKGQALDARLQEAFARHPGRFTLRRLQSGDDVAAAASQAVEEGFRVVAAAGGDGTICAVAERVSGGACLGILPLGTFNFFARGLGLPDDLDAAVDVLATGVPRSIDVGDVNERMFLNNASLGIYPAILQNRETTYRRWGRSRLAAHWSVLKTFLTFYRPLSLEVSVDGQSRRTRTPLAFVAQNAYQLDFYGLEGADCVRQGQFALFLAPDGNRIQLLLYALRLAWRGMQAGRDFELFCGEEIVVTTKRRRRLVARDGERERLSSPFRFTLRRRALDVIVPSDGE